MKCYTITVNGVAYDVTVEEGAGSGVAVSALEIAPFRHFKQSAAGTDLMLGTDPAV